MPFNNSSDIWFSSSNKINGTATQNYAMRCNINKNTKQLIITDNLILGNLMREISDIPIIAFQSIGNSYQILKELERERNKNVTFVFMKADENSKTEKIINNVYSDLIPLGYNLNIKYIGNLKDFFDEDFNAFYALNEAS